MNVLLFVILILLFASFVRGNFNLLAWLSTRDDLWIRGETFFVVVAVLIDIPLLCFLVSWAYKRISSSFKTAKRGLKNQKATKKASKELLKAFPEIDSTVESLEKLRNMGLNPDSTKCAERLCLLLESVSDTQSIRQCTEAVKYRMDILSHISELEKKLLWFAEKYQTVGDVIECKHYLDIVDKGGEKKESNSIREKCEDQENLRRTEEAAINTWKKVAVTLIIIIIALIAILAGSSYSRNHRFEDEIKNQTLTNEMFDNYSINRNDTYQKFLQSAKGRKVLEDNLSGYQEIGDIQSALWLLYVTEAEDVMGETFNRWIIDYGKKERRKKN